MEMAAFNPAAPFREEGMIMKLTILIIIAALGVTMPLLWITGSLTSIIYFCLHGLSGTKKEQTFLLHPNLGLTMADGGKSIDEEKKK
jgi:hypothetical protein